MGVHHWFDAVQKSTGVGAGRPPIVPIPGSNNGLVREPSADLEEMQVMRHSTVEDPSDVVISGFNTALPAASNRLNSCSKHVYGLAVIAGEDINYLSANIWKASDVKRGEQQLSAYLRHHDCGREGYPQAGVDGIISYQLGMASTSSIVNQRDTDLIALVASAFGDPGHDSGEGGNGYGLVFWSVC
ncbi:hypothetical protein VPH35_028863 [Triticum aestivum]